MRNVQAAEGPKQQSAARSHGQGSHTGCRARSLRCPTERSLEAVGPRDQHQALEMREGDPVASQTLTF